MTRKILHALAALAMVAAASLVWAQPAQAAPAGACSVEEWGDPSNFADCARRTAATVGNTASCVTAPTPGSPTSGLRGWFTSQPDTSLRSGVAGLYSRYGVGGYGLDTYDIGCLGSVKHPELVAWNTIASAEFGAAASVLGAANWLRERAYDPGTMFGWSDGFLKSATQALFNYIFTPLGAVTFAAIGLILIWRARRGEMSDTMRITAWALFILVAVTGIAKWPVGAAHTADAAASTGLTALHSVVGPPPQNTPADQCVLGGDSCTDYRSVATRSSDVAVNAVLYRSWLRAMLGTADSDTAKKYGPALYDATAMTWGEAERTAQSPTLRLQLIQQKAATWNAIAEQIRVEDPLAYENLQGIHDTDRVGAGAIALLSALAFAGFDMAASVMILLGFLIFRFAIIGLPLLGTLGVYLPASGGVRRIMHMTAAGFLNIIVFGAAGGLYLAFVDLIFNSSTAGPAQLILVELTGVVLFFLLRPDRHLVHLVTGRAKAHDNVVIRLITAGKKINTGRSETADDSVTAGPDPDEPARPRPEAGPSRPAKTSPGRTVTDTPTPPAAAPVTRRPAPTAGSGPRPETAAGPSPAHPAPAPRRRPSPRPRVETRS